MFGLLESFLTRYPLDAVFEAIRHPTLEGNAVKATSIFSEAQYHNKAGQLVAEFTRIEDFPLIKFYTADPVLKAQAQASLTARYMVDFYIQYIQFLPWAARLRSRNLLDDPIEFVPAEIRRRQLDFSSVALDLYYLLIEFNKEISRYNEDKCSPFKIEPFTMDQLTALLALCDVYKGIGCSAALREEENGVQLIRNLDWTPLNILGSNTMGLLYPTGHQSPDKPNFVFSVTFTPGIIHLSVANDKGLVITLNEATTMDTKRENEQLSAVGQFTLVLELVEQCSSVDEVKEYLEMRQPASSHILTVMDRFGGSGIFEMLPNRGTYKNDLYRFRAIGEGVAPYPIQHVTNHFLEENREPLQGSEATEDSIERYNRLNRALIQQGSAINVAQSTNVSDTVQTLIFTQEKDRLILEANWADGGSAGAVDTYTNTVRYTRIDLTEEFNTLAKRVREVQIQPAHGSSLDKNLLRLLSQSHRLSYYQPELGFELSRFCSQLIIDMTQRCAPDGRGLSKVKATQLASAIIPLVDPNKTPSSESYKTARKLIVKDSFAGTYPQATYALELVLGALVGLAYHSLYYNGLTWSFFSKILDLDEINPAVAAVYVLIGWSTTLLLSDSIERTFFGKTNRMFFGCQLLSHIESARDFEECLLDAP